MPIVIQRVLNGADKRWTCEVVFGEGPLIVDVDVDRPRDKIGQYLFIELAAERIDKWEPTSEAHGITALGDNKHRLVGLVESHMDIGEGTVLYDLHIENGPSYFCIDSNEIGGATLEDGEKIAVEVTGLCFFDSDV